MSDLEPSDSEESLDSNSSGSDDQPEEQMPVLSTDGYLLFKACEDRMKEIKLFLCILGLIWKIPVEVLMMMIRYSR